MKTASASSPAKSSKQKPGSKAGKRSLYDPKLGASNYRKAQDGRFANHPAFLACKELAGVFVGLERLTPKSRKIDSRLAAITGQMDKALCVLRDETKKLKSVSDKLRFAEAIAAFFNPPKAPDQNVWRVCWRAIEMRTTMHEEPSQAELRHAVEDEDHIKFSDEQWKRLMKQTGLNKELPTLLQKTQGGILRKV
jgi:hypothetical protein